MTGAQSQVFQIDSYESSSGNTYQIDTSSTLTVKPNTFNDLLNLSSKRDVVTINTAFKLTIGF